MHSWPFEALLRSLRTAAPVVLLGALCSALGMPALAASPRLTVLTSDDLAANQEFVQQLRETQEPGSRFDVVKLPAAPSAVALSTGPDAGEDDHANAGVRTRSMKTGAVAPDTLTVAVGPSAARNAIERGGSEPLVLAMLTRLDYEALKASPALHRGDRRVGVLLRDPSMADQLALVDAALPQKRRLGIVTTAESEPLLRDLQRAAQSGWTLQIETAPDVKSIAGALRGVLPRSDALMVLPDLIGDDQAATLAVLRAAAGAGVPVFGASDGLVRSGGLAAAVSTPSQLARQARALGQKIATGPSGVMVEAATPATVRVNGNVARGLGLRLPDERELADRVAAAR